MALSYLCTAQAARADFEIRIGGWKNFAYYSAASIHKPVPAPAPQKGLPDVVAVLSPFLETTPQDAANVLLERYIQYHLAMGFSRFLQYTQVGGNPSIWSAWVYNMCLLAL
jgi:hypothetical protein